MEPKLKVLIAASDEFAIPTVEALVNSELVEVVGLVTQSDKAKGREQTTSGNSVKQFWDRLIKDNKISGTPIFQPEKLRLESTSILEITKPDLIVVVAYGQMIPTDMLTIPRYGCINIHASLLPQLRGAVPIPMAILQGLETTGVTIQRMVKELDAGAVYARKSLHLTGDETTASLKAELSVIGAELLLELLPQLIAGTAIATEQGHSHATFCYQVDIAKDKAQILFSTDVLQAERMIRAFNPWPVAWFAYGPTKKRIKIFAARIVESIDKPSNRLQIVRRGKGLYLKLHDGELELLELQLEGKQRRSAGDYLFLTEPSWA